MKMAKLKLCMTCPNCFSKVRETLVPFSFCAVFAGDFNIFGSLRVAEDTAGVGESGLRARNTRGDGVVSWALPTFAANFFWTLLLCAMVRQPF